MRLYLIVKAYCGQEKVGAVVRFEHLPSFLELYPDYFDQTIIEPDSSTCVKQMGLRDCLTQIRALIPLIQSQLPSELITMITHYLSPPTYTIDVIFNKFGTSLNRELTVLQGDVATICHALYEYLAQFESGWLRDQSVEIYDFHQTGKRWVLKVRTGLSPQKSFFFEKVGMIYEPIEEVHYT